MANSASLLLPVSNLTNLLAMRYLDLTFGGFALVMAPVLVVVLIVEYVVLRLTFHRELAGPPDVSVSRGSAQIGPEVPALPLVAVAAMLAGFAALSPLGVEPFWVSGVVAAVLVAWAHRRGLLTVREAVTATHLSFAIFVLCLGVVVAAISVGFVGTTAVLAALLGLNIGSGLTYTGSLANLLWRRGLVRQGENPSMLEFHRLSLVATPVALFAAVTALALVT